MRSYDRCILALATVAWLLGSGAAMSGEAAGHDPDLEAARHGFGTLASPPIPGPSTSAPTARPATELNLDAALQDEPVLDAAAAAALMSENLRKVDAAAATGLAGYDRDALIERLRASEAEVEAWLGHLPAPAAGATH